MILEEPLQSIIWAMVFFIIRLDKIETSIFCNNCGRMQHKNRKLGLEKKSTKKPKQ